MFQVICILQSIFKKKVNKSKNFNQIVEKCNILYYNIFIMKNYKDKKYCVVTYGCQMNVHDSEKIAGMMEDLGMKEIHRKLPAA